MSAKHLYGRGWLGLIPVIGVYAGFSLIYLAITKYKDIRLFLIGGLAFVPTILVYLMLFIYSQTDEARSNSIPGSINEMDKLIKEIEVFKMRHGSYPDSLKQLRIEDPYINIWDPISAKGARNLLEFNYNRVGQHYYLFSSGLDLKPNTGDDVFPDLDTVRLGLIKWKRK